jgi:hypothetical protein
MRITKRRAGGTIALAAAAVTASVLVSPLAAYAEEGKIRAEAVTTYWEPDRPVCEADGHNSVVWGDFSSYQCKPNGDGSYTLYLYP